MQILIIEDDLIIGKNIQTALADEGFAVETALDGWEGEKALSRKKYDCIVMDISLPGKDGFELCRKFRETDNNTPVILLTAFDELEDKVEGYENGADDYLTKPFYMKELLLRIHSLIRRSNSATRTGDAREEIIVAGELMLDLKHKKAFRNQQEIALTPREFQVLRKLMEADGAPVSKMELIKEIWGSIFEHNTNTIEVYINFLRNKIDRPFGSHLIKTRIGHGYYLDMKE